MSKSQMPSVGVVVLCVGFVFVGFWAYAKFSDRIPTEVTPKPQSQIVNAQPTGTSDSQQYVDASNEAAPKSAEQVMSEVQSQQNAEIASSNQSDEVQDPFQSQSSSPGVNLSPKTDSFEIMDINEAKEAIPLIISLMDIDHNQRRELRHTLNSRKIMFNIHPDIYSKMSTDLGFDVAFFLSDMITLREAWLRGDSMNYGREMNELFDRENALMSYCLDRQWDRRTAMYWTREDR